MLTKPQCHQTPKYASNPLPTKLTMIRINGSKHKIKSYRTGEYTVEES